MSWLQRLWATTPHRAMLPGTRWGEATALAGLALTLFVSALMWRGAPEYLLVPPVAASAVIVFALHDSAFAHPWAVFGGSMVSALIGSVCARLVPVPLLAAAMAVPLAMFAMLRLRCLHPPAGAQALLFALAGGPLFAAGSAAALGHLSINLIALVLAGMVVNRCVPGRHYPRLAPPPLAGRADLPPLRRSGLRDEEIRQALAELGRNVDIAEDDLAQVLDGAARHAFQRATALCCRDIMAKDVLAVEFATPLAEAWQMFSRHHIRALPVVDRSRRVVGILTRMDFLGPLQAESGQSLALSLGRWLRAKPPQMPALPETVGEIMQKNVMVVTEETPVMDLVERLCQGGKHHLPVVDGRRRLSGMITQSDLLAALYHRQAWQSRVRESCGGSGVVQG